MQAEYQHIVAVVAEDGYNPLALNMSGVLLQCAGGKGGKVGS
jgi:hypothetical protein